MSRRVYVIKGSHWTVEDICANNHHDRRLTILGIALLMPGLCVKERSHKGNLRLLTAERYPYLKAPPFLTNLRYLYIVLVLFVVRTAMRHNNYKANLPRIRFMQ